MSRTGRVDVALRLKGSGGAGADPGVDVCPPEEEVTEAQLGRNFLFRRQDISQCFFFFLWENRWGKGKGKRG